MAKINGRTDRIHAYLVQQARPCTLREIATATAPKESTHSTCSLLQQMIRRKSVAKVGHGKGNVTYRTGTVLPRRARAAAAGAVAPAATSAGGPLQVMPRNTPHARTHFHLAPAATSIPELALANSARIAADIAAFQAKGGRIERLGPTQFFKSALADNDD